MKRSFNKGNLVPQKCTIKSMLNSQDKKGIIIKLVGREDNEFRLECGAAMNLYRKLTRKCKLNTDGC